MFQNVSKHLPAAVSPHDSALPAEGGPGTQDVLDIEAARVSAFQNVSKHPPLALTPAVQRAVAWLQENPDAAKLSVRKAAQLSGLSETSIYKARKHLNG